MGSRQASFSFFDGFKASKTYMFPISYSDSSKTLKAVFAWLGIYTAEKEQFGCQYIGRQSRSPIQKLFIQVKCQILNHQLSYSKNNLSTSQKNIECDQSTNIERSNNYQTTWIQCTTIGRICRGGYRCSAEAARPAASTLPLLEISDF